jgi:hypothetical protein
VLDFGQGELEARCKDLDARLVVNGTTDRGSRRAPCPPPTGLLGGSGGVTKAGATAND